MSGSTGNLPPGVIEANFVARGGPSQDELWSLQYSLQSTENMVVVITAQPTGGTILPPATFTPGVPELLLPPDQNVDGIFSLPMAGVWNIYVQQVQPVVGPDVLVWSNFAVPAVTGEGRGDGLGFGAGTPTFPPGHKVFQADRLPVGNP